MIERDFRGKGNIRMRPELRYRLILCVQVALLALMTSSAFAQEDFFRGKRIELILPASTGGFISYGLLIAEHWPRHIPGNPSIHGVPMGGAGGIRASNFVANVAKDDGTVLYLMHHNAPTVQALTPKRVQYDARRFKPIGVVSALNAVMVIRTDIGVTSLKDAASKAVVLGSTGVGSYTYIVPNLLNRLKGTQFNVITTYTGLSETILAMDRGEVGGLMSSLSTIKESRPAWIKDDSTARIIFQMGSKRDPLLPDVPLLTEMAEERLEREVYRFMSISNSFARSVVAPAGVPEDRVEILRRSFMAMLADQQFRMDAAKRGLDIVGSDHATIEEGIAAIINSPEDVLELARQITPE
jgi:tripartite-type tricarboxylate transporter receptor subunit TctC